MFVNILKITNKIINKHLYYRFLSKQEKHMIFIKLLMKFLNFAKKWRIKLISGKRKKNQCLRSGSARFWLPVSGSAKICISTDPDPKGKILTKNCKTKIFTVKTQIWTIKKRIDYKNFLISEWFIRIKIKLKIIALFIISRWAIFYQKSFF